MAHTNHLERYKRISGILGPRDPPAVMWVTSSEWAEVATEVNEQPLTVEGNRPRPSNFGQILIPPGLLVMNAKTEDQGFVNDMNQQECPPDFAWRRDNMRKS